MSKNFLNKKYLNKKEKNDVLVLSAFKVFMEEYAEQLTQLNRPTEMIKYAKMSKTFCNKVMQFQLNSLRQGEIDNILKEIRKMKVAIHYTEDALKEFERMKKLDSVMPIETEDFLDVVAYSLGICKTCKFTGDDAENCNLRRIYSKYDIEPLDLYAPEGKCQFQY